jgi:tRNA pseudouridine38-40 synthase
MPVRLKLIVAYDGGSFAGWQSQSHGNTIQDHLELALSQVAKSAVRVNGAGRTDAGVHALAQCAHVDLPERRLRPEQWTAALNALLPPQIRVLKCQYVTDRFHARYSAKGKIYRYRIWSGAVLPPLEVGRAWHVAASLDHEILRSSANVFLGTHDFSGFAANRGKPERDTVRTIRSVRVRRSGALLAIEFDGSGFLYKMVRLMVGSLVRCGLGKMDAKTISQWLRFPRVPRSRFSAPPEGLYLVRVRY